MTDAAFARLARPAAPALDLDAAREEARRQLGSDPSPEAVFAVAAGRPAEDGVARPDPNDRRTGRSG